VHGIPPMYKLVTCPGTEQLELVEYVETPLGMLIYRCSRFRPVCALDCTRQCAVKLQQRARADRSRGPIVLRGDRFELDCELELEDV
jgi:hypothetical protein